jgi:hypothetical protein
MNETRRSLALWIGAAVVVGLLGFLLLNRNTSPVRESGPASADGTTPGSTVRKADGGTDGTAVPDEPSGDGDGDPVAGGDVAANERSYPTYLGGDFDDTSVNDAPPLGADENGCDLNYEGACVPSPPVRVTCEDLGIANLLVVLGDPHGLDPDGDGVACQDDTIVRTDHGENTTEPRD